MSVPAWAWFAFAAFVVAMLALDLLVLHRRAHEVSLKEAGFWSAAWVAMGLGFGALPTTEELHGQRFIVRDNGRLLVTPLLLALIVVETTDVIFAVDSIPAVLAVTTDTFVVYTFPHWASPAFIAGVLAAVALLSVRDARRHSLAAARRTPPVAPSAAGPLGQSQEGLTESDRAHGIDRRREGPGPPGNLTRVQP